MSEEFDAILEAANMVTEAKMVHAMSRLRGHEPVERGCGMGISDEVGDIAAYMRMRDLKIAVLQARIVELQGMDTKDAQKLAALVPATPAREKREKGE